MDKTGEGDLTEKSSQEKLTWCRFSRYHIVDGMILPAPDAKPTPYNPWTEYRKANRAFPKQARRRDDQRGKAAYQDLFDLVTILQPADDRRINSGDPDWADVSAEEAGAILSFARDNGLLGIFHTEVAQIVEPGAKRVWVRWGAQWIPDDWQLSFDSNDAVSLSGIEGMALRKVPFHDLSTRFFGRGMPSPLPHPDSGEFFQSYGERVSDFIRAACTFRDSVEDFLEDPGDPSGLNLLLTRIGQSIRLRRGVAEYEPIYPSLLTALADMFARDQMAGLRMSHCAGCGQSIRTNFSRTRFCSEPCRWKVIKRTYRTRLAAKEKKSAKRGRVK